MLTYPGKVYYHPDSNTIFISDTGNNRVVQVRVNDRLVYLSDSLLSILRLTNISSTPGHKISSFQMEPPSQTNCVGEILKKYPGQESQQLDSPQGVLVYKSWLYVCDTNNHRVVRVELESGGLEVVCGTGCQGHDLEGGKLGD